MPSFSYNDIELNYIIEGSGEPLVFVSGTFTKLQMWNYQIDFFREKMTIVAFDNRGVGKSSRPDFPYTMELFIEDLKQLLDYIGITEGIHLCGSSMGAMVSQKYALKYPKMIKTLILCAPGSYYPLKTSEQNLLTYNILKDLDLEQRVKFFFPLMYSREFKKRLETDREFFDEISKDMNFCAQLVDPPLYKDYINQNEAFKNFDMRDSIKDIIQPTLILSGSKDKMSIPGEIQSMNEEIPNSELEIIPGAGHAFNIEFPEETNRIIWKFVQEHLS
ncbi:MAG: alpha/beta hydrolase [Candidatus Lokiarchaeota archaeon]|nr:alpha/beta hydrolase [Candidatus Lokiarchaeota archaeon]